MNRPRRRGSPWRTIIGYVSLAILLVASAAFAALGMLGQEANSPGGVARARVLFDVIVSSGLLLLLTVWRLVAGLKRRLQEAEALLHEMATTDELTVLANRRTGQERLLDELVRASRHRRPFSLLLLDLDNFKQVNDTQGHDAGDAVLKAVAKAVTALVRQTDLVARWGGEEFLVLLTETGLAGAKATGERIRQAIASMPIIFEGHALQVTVSLGAAEFVRHERVEQAADDLLKRADKALYNAKHHGRNRVEADVVS